LKQTHNLKLESSNSASR